MKKWVIAVFLAVYLIAVAVINFSGICGIVQYAPEVYEGKTSMEILTEAESLKEIEIKGVGVTALKESLSSKKDSLSLERLKQVEQNPAKFADTAIVYNQNAGEAQIVFFDKCRWKCLFRIPYTEFCVPYCSDTNNSCKFWAGGWPWYAQCKQHGSLPTGCICTAKAFIPYE